MSTSSIGFEILICLEMAVYLGVILFKHTNCVSVRVSKMQNFRVVIIVYVNSAIWLQDVYLAVIRLFAIISSLLLSKCYSSLLFTQQPIDETYVAASANIARDYYYLNDIWFEQHLIILCEGWIKFVLLLSRFLKRDVTFKARLISNLKNCLSCINLLVNLHLKNTKICKKTSFILNFWIVKVLFSMKTKKRG